ncbi:hypothetical protein TNCV_167531 [Trichonephila clavipes]|nr:hypothetical protein TNCV_167531 [Trichonephila clavipes]
MWPRWSSGQGIGSWLVYHEFEPCTTKDPPYREAMRVKSVESSNVLLLVWLLRDWGQLRCRPRHLTIVQNYEVRRQKLSFN